MDEVAETTPLLAWRGPFNEPTVRVELNVAAPPKMFDPLNVWLPENVLESPRSVDDANVQVEVENEYARPEELTATPPAERPVSEKLPEKVLAPVKVFAVYVFEMVDEAWM